MAKKKTLEELTNWVTLDLNTWEQRNARFQRDQDLYRLQKPEGLGARVESDITVLNDPKILVQKVSRLIARHPNVIQVDPTPGVDPTIAQKVENFLYAWDKANNQRWVMGLNNPYRYDQAFYAVLRGWVCERTMLRPDGIDEPGDPSSLWDHRLFDPANVYPHTSGGLIDRVTHSHRMTVGEMRADPFYGKAIAKSFADADDRTDFQVNSVYWRSTADGPRGTWWYGCYLGGTGGYGTTSENGDWIKPPTELGYNPWTIVFGKGASYRQTPWDECGYFEEMGTGILDESAENQKYLNRLATRLNEMISLESNPPLTLYSDAGQLKQVEFWPGSRNYLAAGDKLELHKIGPQLNDYKLLWDIFMQRNSRSGLPNAFFAEYGGESGFSAAVLLAAGKDVLFPFVEAVNTADQLKYRKVLELYRDFGPSKPLPTKLVDTQSFEGLGKVMSATIDVQEIYAQGTMVDITREDMTPQELASRINTGLAMVDKKAISLETFRKEWAKIRNPAAENVRIIGESVYMSEDVMRALVPLTLSNTGQEFLRKLWETTQNAVPPEQPPQAGPQGMPPQPQGMPGTPGVAPQMPMPPGMVPPQTQLGSVDPAAAQMNMLLSLLNGGAQGGAGAGGVPPPGGQGSPVPLLPTPARLF